MDNDDDFDRFETEFSTKITAVRESAASQNTALDESVVIAGRTAHRSLL